MNPGVYRVKLEGNGVNALGPYGDRFPKVLEGRIVLVLCTLADAFKQGALTSQEAGYRGLVSRDVLVFMDGSLVWFQEEMLEEL